MAVFDIRHRSQKLRNNTVRAVLSFAAFISPMAAGALTVKDGLEACESGLVNGSARAIDVTHLAICSAMAEGVGTVLVYNCSMSKEEPSAFRKMAAGEPASIEAVMQGFIGWAKKNPQLWDEKFVEGMIASTVATFPCDS